MSPYYFKGSVAWPFGQINKNDTSEMCFQEAQSCTISCKIFLKASKYKKVQNWMIESSNVQNNSTHFFVHCFQICIAITKWIKLVNLRKVWICACGFYNESPMNIKCLSNGEKSGGEVDFCLFSLLHFLSCLSSPTIKSTNQLLNDIMVWFNLQVVANTNTCYVYQDARETTI